MMDSSKSSVTATARLHMVLSQLRPNRVYDERILAAMLSVPRELFLPESLRHISYSDEHLRLDVSGSRIMLSPLLTATLLQAGEIEKGETVLIIAGSCAYLGAIAERLKTTVFLLDHAHFFSDTLESTIVDLQLDGLVCLHGDPREGWQREAPYSTIIIDGSVRSVPASISSQLAVGGKLVALRIGDDDTGEVIRMRKDASGCISTESLCEGQAPLLAEFSDQPAFVF